MERKSTALLESVIWHEGGDEQKAGAPLGAMGFTCLSVQVRTVHRHSQGLASCATGGIAQFSSFSTNMEDQEKPRNLTDKRSTVSPCSDFLF